VYSITSRASYDEARSYLDTTAQYQRITGKDIPVAVVGNKMDLERYRSVLASHDERVDAFDRSTVQLNYRSTDLGAYQPLWWTR